MTEFEKKLLAHLESISEQQEKLAGHIDGIGYLLGFSFFAALLIAVKVCFCT